MKRTLSLAFSAAAVSTLAVLYALAVQAQTPGVEAAAERAAAAEAAEEQARAAADQARAVVEQAREIAERAADDARRQAEVAVERAEAMARDVQVEIEARAEAAVDAAESADVVVENYGGPIAAPKVKFRIAGPKWERRVADPETMQKFELDRKLSGQISELAAKYKAAEGDDAKRDVATEIAKRVQDQFTVRQALREKELVELEEQIERLRGLHSRREEEKQRIITDRVQQILREVDGLGWGDGGAEWGAGGGADFKFAPGEFGGGAGFGGFGENPFGEGPKKIIARAVAGVPGAPAAITITQDGDVLKLTPPVPAIAPLPAGAAPPPVAPWPAVAPVKPAPPAEPVRN